MPDSCRLSCCLVSKEEKNHWLKIASSLMSIEIDRFVLSDIEALAQGAYTPLQGFMAKKDYLNVLKNLRLASGELFPLPITLRLDEEQAQEIKVGSRILLKHEGEAVAGMLVEDLFRYDKRKEARLVFGTEDHGHPGVRRLYNQGDCLVGGRVFAFAEHFHHDFMPYRLTPRQARELFAQKGWKTIVGFQTRNPIHRAHEYLIKTALESVDGVFIHPLVGETKKGDIPPEIRMQCYKVLIEKYFPKDRVVLGVNPCSMRYAGPREAVFHALIRRNYGCTHFIVGRDHAGVGNYYGSYEAQKLISSIPSQDLGITPFLFEHAFFCLACGNMATTKTCPHDRQRVFLSGTEVRRKLKQGEPLPETFTRKEVAEILSQQKALLASA